MKKSTKKIFKAKKLCRERFPYLSALVYGMPCTPSPAVETMGVDAQGRCYYSEAFVEGLPVEQIAYVLLHETFHLALSHHKRRKVWCDPVSERDALVWNIAADMCIETALYKDASDWEPDDIVTWQKYHPYFSGIVHGLTTERYADILREHLPIDADKPTTGGSCADGIPRPGERPGAGAAAIDGKLAQVADAMAKAEAVSPGSTPACLRQAIDKCLGRSSDWTVVLKEIVQRSTRDPLAPPSPTYRIANRRAGGVPGAVIRPGVERIGPECTVVVDTSGSMSPYIGPAVSAVAAGLRRVNRPRVICWDVNGKSDQRLASVAGFDWVGGGGTCMDDAVVFADKAKSDCIVVITDGETSWPSQRTKARLVIALVKDSRKHYPTPSWARVVPCWEEVGYAG